MRDKQALLMYDKKAPLVSTEGTFLNALKSINPGRSPGFLIHPERWIFMNHSSGKSVSL